MNIKYYVMDRTVGNSPIFFDTLNEVVSHLEGTVIRTSRVNRKQYMDNLADFGFGPDDAQGKSFTDSVTEHLGIETGIVKQGKCIRCNIHEATYYAKYANEMGD